MNAEQVRGITKDINENIKGFIKDIDGEIQTKALMGKRFIECNYGIGFNDDLEKHYTEQGFKVIHTTSPWESLRISW